MHREIYRSSNYAPDRVVMRYVRAAGPKGYNVIECAARTKPGPGSGPTIREYDTPGEEIPDDVRDEALKAQPYPARWPVA